VLVLIVAVGALGAGCHSDDNRAQSTLFSVPSTIVASQQGCESIPLPQFNLGGVTYVAEQGVDTVTDADLGDVIGVQAGEIPQGLLQCEAVQLEDGQGSLEPGAHVYAIRGVDTSIAIAAEAGPVHLKLYAP
jgi:hypothetical protein